MITEAMWRLQAPLAGSGKRQAPSVLRGLSGHAAMPTETHPACERSDLIGVSPPE